MKVIAIEDEILKSLIVTIFKCSHVLFSAAAPLTVLLNKQVLTREELQLSCNVVIARVLFICTGNYCGWDLPSIIFNVVVADLDIKGI